VQNQRGTRQIFEDYSLTKRQINKMTLIIGNQPAPSSWSSSTLVLVGGSHTINEWSGGTITLVNGSFTDDVLQVGQETLNAVGKTSVNISGQLPAAATLNIHFVGALSGGLDPAGDTITISGAGKFEAGATLTGNGGPSGGYGGSLIFNVPDEGPVISVGESSGVIDFAQMTFLRHSTGVTFNDGFGPNGISLPAEDPSPAFATTGQLPTLEIDNLAALKSIVLSQTKLQLDFADGTKVNLPNVHVNDPKYFQAEQTASGSLYLSEAPRFPTGGHAIPITVAT
jgi:hypothetical protein